MARTTTARTLMSTALGDNISGAIGADDVRSVFTSAFDLIDRSPGSLNVRDFGAVGDNVSNDTAAIQAALNQGNWKTICFPSGTYRVTAPLTVTNPITMRLLGECCENTIIRMAGSGTILAMTNANHCTIDELTFLRESGTGSGVVLSGQHGRVSVDKCSFQSNQGVGLGFTGTEALQQSGNRVTRCSFLSNTLDQLYLLWSNDSVIAFNVFGGGFGPYASGGCHLDNSSAGQYVSNEHWNNERALRISTSNFLRIANNRFEESRQEAVYATSSTWCQFTGNYLHTNSQAATGTYSALRLNACTNWNITGNTVMSWNTLRHLHSIQADATSSSINIVGNMMDHSTGADINTSSATNVNSTGNM